MKQQREIKFTARDLRVFQDFLKTMAPDPDAAKAFCCAYIGIDEALIVRAGSEEVGAVRRRVKDWGRIIEVAFDNWLVEELPEQWYKELGKSQKD